MTSAGSGAAEGEGAVSGIEIFCAAAPDKPSTIDSAIKRNRIIDEGSSIRTVNGDGRRNDGQVSISSS